MAAAVLNPQDYLRDPFTTNRGGLLSTPAGTKIRRNPNPTTPTTTPSSSTRSSSKHSRGQSNNHRRKRSPNSSPPPRPTADSFVSPQAAPAKILSMGQVKILKRGEEIQNKNNTVEAVNDQKVEKKLDLSVSPPVSPKKPVAVVRVGAAPLLNRSVGGFYAGSGFFTSPPPSSLPVPVFLKKSTVVGVDSEATNDLRMLLNLTL